MRDRTGSLDTRALGRWLAVGATCALLCWSAPAAAQSGADRAVAQALFDEGVKLRESGKTEAACEKFAESLRLDPAVGTRFNLADCAERVGRHATAWSHFLEVAAATEMAGQQDRADVARARAKALEQRLSRLTVTPAQPVAGLTIRRNDVTVGKAQWSTAVPVDQGSYTIVAEAPGKQPWSTTVVVEGEGREVSVAVPVLVDAPTPAPGSAGPVGGQLPPPDGGHPPPPDSGSDNTGMVLGLTFGGLGLVGIGVGAAFGVIAINKKDELDAACPDLTRCTQAGLELHDDAELAGNVSTGTIVAGGVLAATGLILWLALPSGTEQAAAGPLRFTSDGIEARF